MSSLIKDLTWENHKRVEKTKFAKKLLKKELSPEQYYIYLSNQASSYWFLESYSSDMNLFDGIEELKRSDRILDDLRKIEKHYSFKRLNSNTNAVESYISHIRKISIDKEKLLSHIYVRHMGDLYGGQIIKKYVPVEFVSYYEFEGNIEVLKQNLKERITKDQAIEANRCFDMIYDFFIDLENQFEF